MELVAVKETSAELTPDFYEQLEAGNILFFPQTPIRLSEEDESFLSSQRQSEASYHKNIAYRPLKDVLTGAGRGSDAERLRRVMREFSRQAGQLLARLLARYAKGWQLDFASFRPFEEAGRNLSLHSRNDLLHFDAFPTRPTHGDRILRFFVNLNPERPRVWLTTDGFEPLVERFAEEAGLLKIGRRAARPLRRRMATVARSLHLSQFSRSPYDAAMHRFHNYLKENEPFQKTCLKQLWEFPPQSSWLVFTDMVSHAVLSGQLALEQTFIVPRRLMLRPELAPASVLERLVGEPVVWQG
jgi:3-deoxy-D-manno-oct-2-ulosonic acid (Kdo) hydroxylase